MKLVDLIKPIDLKLFFDRYWRKEPLYLSTYDSFDDVIYLDQINEYLTASNLIYPFVRIVSDGEELPLEQYCSQGTYFKALDKTKVFKLFEEGKTLVIQGAQYNFKSLSELKASLSVELNSIINVNIYITPPSSQGFSPHYDTHEVFVMQIFGTKTWRLYDYKCKYPLKTWELTNSEVKHYIESSPEHEIVLSPGDVLYFPAGVVHDAFCIDELSIHITVGAGSKTVLDFLKYTMEKAEVAEYFRMPLDDGSQESLNKLKSKFSELFDESYSTYNSNNKKLEEKIQDSLFIDYCCVDNINKLGANDVLLSQEDYLPENSLEKVIVSSVKQEKVLEFFSSIPLQERVNYQRSLKGLIRKGVLKFNH